MINIHYPEHKIPDWSGIQSYGLVSKHNNFLPSVGGNISSGSKEGWCTGTTQRDGMGREEGGKKKKKSNEGSQPRLFLTWET